MWYGALATAAATFVGHYPVHSFPSSLYVLISSRCFFQWFGTYNYLSDVLPAPHTLPQKLLRQAFIGFCASVVSDTVSNSLRVVKTYRQVNETRVSYMEAAKRVIAVDGWVGFLGRGLPTRILANGLQGLMFSVLWKLFLDLCVLLLYLCLNKRTDGLI
jgi:hypothetical protein